MQWVRVRIRVRDRVRARVKVTVRVRVRVSVRNCRNRECRNMNLYPLTLTSNLNVIDCSNLMVYNWCIGFYDITYYVT